MSRGLRLKTILAPPHVMPWTRYCTERAGTSNKLPGETNVAGHRLHFKS